MKNVRKSVSRLRFTFDVSEAAYSDGDVINTVKELPNALMDGLNSGRIEDVVLHNSQLISNEAYSLFFFRSEPTETYTDNTQFAPSDANAKLLSRPIVFLNSGRFVLPNNALILPANMDHPVSFEADSGLRSLFVLLRADAAMDFAAASEALALDIYFRHD